MKRDGVSRQSLSKKAIKKDVKRCYAGFKSKRKRQGLFEQAFAG
jgi:hypothetical protein